MEQSIELQNVSNNQDWNTNSNNWGSNSNNSNKGSKSKRNTPNTLALNMERPNMFQTPSFQFTCQPSERGTFVFPHVDGPTASANAAPKLQLVEYVDNMADLLRSNGIYVWMIFSDDSFAAARAFSVYETMSKHGDLYRRSGFKPVRAAGECQIMTGRRIVYNFQSGSFMAHIVERFIAQYPGRDYLSLFQAWMDRKWKSAGASWIQLDRSDASMLSFPRVDSAVLRNYQQAGIPVYEFDTKSDCLEYSRAVSPLATARLKTWEAQYDALKKKGYTTLSFGDWLLKQGHQIPTALTKEPRTFV